MRQPAPSSSPGYSEDQLRPLLEALESARDGDFTVRLPETKNGVLSRIYKTFNQVVPLFDQAHFMRNLTGWYNHSIPRDNVVWASILMVCALGLRFAVQGVPVCAESAEKREWANHCMRNAQGVMSELCPRDKDTLGLQVLLALVLQFHNSSDRRPASVLLGP